MIRPTGTPLHPSLPVPSKRPVRIVGARVAEPQVLAADRLICGVSLVQPFVLGACGGSARNPLPWRAGANVQPDT